MNQVVYAAGKLWSGVNTVIRTSNGASSQTDRSGIAYFIVTPSTPTATTVAGTIAKQGYVALGNNDSAAVPVDRGQRGRQGRDGVLDLRAPLLPVAPRTRRSTRSTVPERSTSRLPARGRPTTSPGYEAFGGDGVARWGDYSAAVAGDDGTIWTATEWIPGTFGYPPFLANWGTLIGNVSP